ncbi:hypothetical protein M5361_00060 [Ligilactobacillus agilis]|nr:hypothetical protein [Ligilactobacillus agilis]
MDRNWSALAQAISNNIIIINIGLAAKPPKEIAVSKRLLKSQYGNLLS